MFYDGATLYASVYAKNTYTSTDKGNSWTDMGEQDNFFISITSHNGALYAAGFGKDSIYVLGTPTGGGPDTTDTTGNDTVNAVMGHVQQMGTMNIFPNPFSGSATVTLKGIELRQPVMEIYNMHGQVVASKSFSGKTVAVEQGELRSGMYFLRIKDGGKTVDTRKIAIE